MWVTLAEAKAQVNIEADYSLDDALLTRLIDVAEEKVARELDVANVEALKSFAGANATAPPATIVHAILLNVSHYYSNREQVTERQTYPLCEGARHLIQMYRKCVI